KEQRRGEQTGGEIAVIDDLVERVQLPGVVKAKVDKRREAENIEVLRLLGAAAAEVNEQANDEVGEADRVLVHHCAIEGNLANDHVLDRDFYTIANNVVGATLPHAQPGQSLRNVEGV